MSEYVLVVGMNERERAEGGRERRESFTRIL